MPPLFRNNILPEDAALIHVKPPDEESYCSFGLSADYAYDVAKQAPVCIAQINPLYPKTGVVKIYLDKITT